MNLSYAATLAFMILTVACYKPAHSSTTYGSFSYQFDHPEQYCRERLTDTGFDMFCPEGRIEVTFVKPAAGESIQDILANILGESTEDSGYRVSELAGKRSDIILAESEQTDAIEADSPVYVAVFPFDSDEVVIAKGFLYEAEFEDQFRPAYRALILTLEPFSK
jgi:hypothetical protein